MPTLLELDTFQWEKTSGEGRDPVALSSFEVIAAIVAVSTTLQYEIMNLTLTAALLLLAGLAVAACASSPTKTELDKGRLLVEANCSSCHAVGDLDVSPAPEAPPFRRLSEGYRVATLEEALTKGISAGHPAMPEFEFTPEDVKSIIAYLQSVQAGDPS